MPEAALWLLAASSVAFGLLAIAGYRLLVSVLEEANEERTVDDAEPATDGEGTRTGGPA